MATSKSPRRTRPVALEQAVEEIASNLNRLTTRLIGDEAMQAKGLVQEVNDLRQKTEDGFTASAEAQRLTAETLGKIQARMEGFEQFRVAQEAANKKFDEVAVGIEKAKNIAFGSWKTLALIGTLLASCSGLIGWAASKYFHDQQTAVIQTLANP